MSDSILALCGYVTHPTAKVSEEVNRKCPCRTRQYNNPIPWDSRDSNTNPECHNTRYHDFANQLPWPTFFTW